MKPFEERYTAWVDGELAGSELPGFEAELALRARGSFLSPEEDRADARRLGEFLRAHAVANPSHGVGDGELFDRQTLQAIEKEISESSAFPAVSARQTQSNLIWAGVSCLGIAAILFVSVVLPEMYSVSPPADYFAQVLNAKAGDGISAVAYHDDDANVTVVWLDGMDYMPQERRK